MSEWADAYKDSRWQMMRLEVMKRDGCRCKWCGSGGEDGSTLNVHHAYYEKGNKPWEYPMNSLTTLCEDCHMKIHNSEKDLMLAAVNRSAMSFEGARVMLYMFRETLEQFGVLSHEIMAPGNVEDRKRTAREADEKLCAYAAKLLAKTYRKKEARK